VTKRTLPGTSGAFLARRLPSSCGHTSAHNINRLLALAMAEMF
jgi:hypothetical protein